MDTNKHEGGVELVQCSMAGTCRRAEFCAAGRPHAPDLILDAGGRCFDVIPYVEGGVFVWGEAVVKEDGE